MNTVFQRLTHCFSANQIQWFLVSLVFLTGLFAQLQLPICSDDIWLILIAKRWLAGGTYAHDFFENNPPLIVYLSTIPLLFSKLMHLSFSAAMRVFTFLLGFLSIFFSNICFKKLFHRDLFKVAVMTVTLSLPYFILPGYAFGEREHITVMLIMPYILCLALRCDHKANPDYEPFPLYVMILVGVLAALGFGLKVYFLVALLLIECYALWVKKSIRTWFRPEALALCITMIFYFMSIFILMPTYMSVIFPIVMHFYVGFEDESFYRLTNCRVFFLVPIAACLGGMIYRFTSHRHLLSLFLITTLGFIIEYLMQRKEWYYHTIPLFTFILMILGCVVISLNANFRRESRPLMRTTLYVLLGVAVEIFLCFFMLLNLPMYKHDLENAIRALDNHQPVYVFSTEFGDYVSVFEAHAQLSPRFPAFWMLPGMLDCFHQSPDARCHPYAEKLKQDLFRMVTDDFKHYHPGLVLVANSKSETYLSDPPYFDKQRFDYIYFFSEDAAFKKIWRQYRYVKMVKGYEMFVWEKK